MAVLEKKKIRNQDDGLMKGDLGFYAVVLLCLGSVSFVNGLGSMSTIAATYDNSTGLPTVCAMVMSSGIQCAQGTKTATVFSTESFLGISGGKGSFCGLKQGGNKLLCWKVGDIGSKIIYDAARNVEEIVVEGTSICLLNSGTGYIYCTGDGFYNLPGRFNAISKGPDFTCGLLNGNGEPHCWGRNKSEIVNLKGRNGMRKLFAGGGHVCAIGSDGVTACWGQNDAGQTAVPSGLASGFKQLALGDRHTCGIRSQDKSVVCWGAKGTAYSGTESFEKIVGGDSYTCGLLTRNLTVQCWGGRGFGSGMQLSLPRVLPGACTSSECSCGVYPGSMNFCGGSQRICNPCST